ncbi:MAG: tyrosine-type recombinase/integrase [Rhodomicrobium sp.]
MASIRKRRLPSGEIRWQLDYKDLAGARRAKQFKTKGEAVAFETKVRADIAAGTHVADGAAITVREAADLWLQRARTEGLEASTLKQYGEHIDLHINPLLGDTKLSRLTKPAVEAFRDQLLVKRSRALARKVLTSLKGVLNEAQRRGLVNQNVAAGAKVSASKRHKEEIEVPSKDELRAIVNAAGELWPAARGLPWRAFVIVALFSGMRLSELRGLSWDSVSLTEGCITIRQRADFRGSLGAPKSKAGKRDVPLAPMALNALKTWRLACPHTEGNLVFPNSAGEIPSSSSIYKTVWFPLLRAIGLMDHRKSASGNQIEAPRYIFHCLRHSAASLFIEQGWTPEKVMTVMGHSSIQMTFDLYGHLWKTLEDDAKAMAQIEARLLG